MIMKSEKPEEEDDNIATVVHRETNNAKQQLQQQQQHQQHADKMCTSTPQTMPSLSGYYLNGMGMQSVARLGKILGRRL